MVPTVFTRTHLHNIALFTEEPTQGCSSSRDKFSQLSTNITHKLVTQGRKMDGFFQESKKATNAMMGHFPFYLIVFLES